MIPSKILKKKDWRNIKIKIQKMEMRHDSVVMIFNIIQYKSL